MISSSTLSARPAFGDAEHDLDPRRSLRPNSLRFLGSVGNAVGIQAPTAGVSFLPALMAGVVGESGPLAFLLALIAMLFVAYAFVTFTKDTASAGSVYAYNGRSLGASAGFVSVFLLLGVYIAYAASVYASNANIVLNLFPGASVPWIAVGAMFWLLTLALTYRRITVSSAVIVVLEGMSLTLVAVVAAAVLVHGGAGSGALSAKPFTPNGLPVATLGLGVVLAFTGFSGFEVAATLGEESRMPRRVIPRSVIVALLVSGFVYTFMAWIETVGFDGASGLAMSNLPLVDIAHRYVSPTMGTVVNTAALISGIGAQLACLNGANRLLFAIGRDGLGPSWLSRTHREERSPVGALAVTALVSLAGMLAMVETTPLNAFFYLSTYGADMILIVYLLTLIGAIMWSARRGVRNPLRYAVLTAGVAVIGYVIKNTVYPLPEFPFNLCMYAAVATVLLGAMMLVAVPGLRRRLRTSALFAR